MILGVDELLEELARDAARAGRPMPDVRDVLVDAIRDADERAGGDPAIEPAALFFALAQRSASYIGIAEHFVPGIAHAAAEAHGFELADPGADLTIFRLRILRGFLGWDELRAAFAERLRPIGAPEIEPPKRLR